MSVRDILEGTWQLAEWHIGGEILRPPVVDGRWIKRDGVASFMLARTTPETTDGTFGFGVYEMDEENWRYRYIRVQSASHPVNGTPRMTATTPPEDAWLSFRIVREPGLVALVNATGDDRREYEGPYFTLILRGQVQRRWVRVGGVASGTVTS